MNNSDFRRLMLSSAVILFFAAIAIVLLSSEALADSSIYGTVTDAETDDPIADADVYVYESGNRENNHKTKKHNRT